MKILHAKWYKNERVKLKIVAVIPLKNLILPHYNNK